MSGITIYAKEPNINRLPVMNCNNRLSANNHKLVVKATKPKYNILESSLIFRKSDKRINPAPVNRSKLITTNPKSCSSIKPNNKTSLESNLMELMTPEKDDIGELISILNSLKVIVLFNNIL